MSVAIKTVVAKDGEPDIMIVTADVDDKSTTVEVIKEFRYSEPKHRIVSTLQAEHPLPVPSPPNDADKLASFKSKLGVD